MFTLQNLPSLAGSARTWRYAARASSRAAKFDLSVSMFESGRACREVEYNSDLFDAPTVERLIGTTSNC
jgi:hypothetical protein